MTARRKRQDYVVCVSNEGYRVSLVVRRIYITLPDPDSAKRGLLRVIDESGEDYLFPEQLFAPIDVPAELERLLAAAS